MTKSECGTGDGCTLAAISPEIWATSDNKYAPTSFAISENFSKSIASHGEILNKSFRSKRFLEYSIKISFP